MSAPEPLARYVMIGGFLGAGKTTAVDQFARFLTERGLRVGLITNDQSAGLVDTALLRSHGFAVEEITGGCFCCRFDSLNNAADQLTQQTRPEVFVAEPVGSCTDLLATVSYPLRRIYGDRFRIAPLSVLVDPIRASRVLSLVEGRAFSPKVVYVYRKQLEEARLIVINKTDLLEPDRLARLRSALAETFPRAEVLACSARQGIGLDEWFARLTGDEDDVGEAAELDYDEYAAGEAALGWLNCTVTVTAGEAFDGNETLHGLARSIQNRLETGGAAIAHLKMTLSPDQGHDIAVINLVGNDMVPELSQRLTDPVQRGQLLVNLRAEAAPELLEAVTREVLGDGQAVPAAVSLTLEHLECFRPARPEPTHRMTTRP